MNAALEADTVLRLRPLTVVAQGEDFLVGDPERNSFVVLPEIGVYVIELLRAGRPLGAAGDEATRHAGTDVDVVDFARSLCELGFAEVTTAATTTVSTDVVSRPPRWAALVVGPAAPALAVLATVACVLAYATHPGLLPAARDPFFLADPVRSLVALTLITYALRAAHELCHTLAARARGVASRVRVGRRLYLLVFETDLTGLWGLPRRQRYWPLLIGMGFDAVVLAVVLAARLAAPEWWTPAPVVGRLLAAVAFMQFAGVVAQFFVFLRTDVYAAFVVWTGCFNLWQVTRLILRRGLRLASPAHRQALAEAHPRDVAVARWYVWVYAAGLVLAGWFFVRYFAPATVHLVAWLVRTLRTADPGRLAFWEALLFGVVILSPRLLTLGVFARAGLRRLRREEV